MSAPVRPRRLSPLLGAAAVWLLATAGLWYAAAPAHAATATVEVANTATGSFTPRTVTVAPGDTVTWEWVADEAHTVSFEDPEIPNGACVRVLRSCQGHRHVVTFESEGEYAYVDDVGGSTGTVVVAEPAPEPTTSPTPTPEATSQPSPSPSPTPTPTRPTPSPSPEPEPPSPPSSEPEPTSGPEAEPSPTASVAPQTAASPPVEPEGSPEPTTSAGDPTITPADRSPSPVPDPTFEDFPEGTDPEPGQDVEGEVALDAPGDGEDTARTIWGVLGGVTVLGTLGVFGRRVLFADAWDA